MLYSKNGSIPYPYKDETDGWIEVPEPSACPEGKEVVWWFPPGWVIRDPMPVKEGFTYSWNQSEEKWNEFPVEQVAVPATSSNEIPALTTDQISALTTDQISSLG
jgi:hypothetical protein